MRLVAGQGGGTRHCAPLKPRPIRTWGRANYYVVALLLLSTTGLTLPSSSTTWRTTGWMTSSAIDSQAGWKALSARNDADTKQTANITHNKMVARWLGADKDPVVLFFGEVYDSRARPVLRGNHPSRHFAQLQLRAPYDVSRLDSGCSRNPVNSL